MTPEQLTRFEALLAKSSLTASENQELTFLKCLATSGAPTQASGGGDADPADDGEEDDDDEEEEGAPAGGEPAAGDPKSTKPGFLAQAKALATPKSALVARNSELTATIGRLTAEKAQLTQTIAANATTIAGLQTEVATLKGQLAEAKTKAKTVTQELAGLGVGEEKLPASDSGEKGKTYNSEDEVKAALEAATSFEEKAAILDAWEKTHTA